METQQIEKENIVEKIHGTEKEVHVGKKVIIALVAALLLAFLALTWILNTGEQAQQVVPTPVVIKKEVITDPVFFKEIKSRLALLEEKIKPPVCDTPPPKKHIPVRRTQAKRATPKVVVAQLPQAGTKCFHEGHEGIVKILDGKIHCEWERPQVVQQIVLPPPPLAVAQVTSLQEGSGCTTAEGRHGTHRVVDHQLRCVWMEQEPIVQQSVPVRSIEPPARYYRPPPEVVYYEEEPMQVVYYDEPQQEQVVESSGSSWLPWIGAGAVALGWWAYDRNRGSTPSGPRVITLPAGPGVDTLPAGPGVGTLPAVM